ncbi:hypothetical protein BpHYR1_025948 [Brachionus plicatilis]|uniref:Uncharacterized protein n=1 Tax=Brachionus plicatilis TaxID=10195 RepID=A0A3M7SMJ4_BRAPC|nr:hypothetical protein BpHYR1_025948 [Brachionus plicatilis]
MCPREYPPPWRNGLSKVSGTIKRFKCGLSKNRLKKITKIKLDVKENRFIVLIGSLKLPIFYNDFYAFFLSIEFKFRTLNKKKYFFAQTQVNPSFSINIYRIPDSIVIFLYLNKFSLKSFQNAYGKKMRFLIKQMKKDFLSKHNNSSFFHEPLKTLPCYICHQFVRKTTLLTKKGPRFSHQMIHKTNNRNSLFSSL